MTGRVFDMVSYLIRRSMEDGCEDHPDDLVEDLVRQGHSPQEIHAALSILQNIHQRLDEPQIASQAPPSERFFLNLEEFLLPGEVRGRLTSLVAQGVLTFQQREEVIERIMFAEQEDLSSEDIDDLVDEIVSDFPRRPFQLDDSGSKYYH